MRAVTQCGDSRAQPAPNGDAPRGTALGRGAPRAPGTLLPSYPTRARPGRYAGLGFDCSRRGRGPPELEGKLGAGPGWAGGRQPGETTCSSGWAQGSPRGWPGRAAPRKSQATGEAALGVEFTRVPESTAQDTGRARCQVCRLPWGASPGNSLHRADGPEPGAGTEGGGSLPHPSPRTGTATGPSQPCLVPGGPALLRSDIGQSCLGS